MCAAIAPVERHDEVRAIITVKGMEDSILRGCERNADHFGCKYGKQSDSKKKYPEQSRAQPERPSERRANSNSNEVVVCHGITQPRRTILGQIKGWGQQL